MDYDQKADDRGSWRTAQRLAPRHFAHFRRVVITDLRLSAKPDIRDVVKTIPQKAVKAARWKSVEPERRKA